MKTENSTTLFRFVTIRSAQTLNLNALKSRFIQLPKSAEKGLFFEAIKKKRPEKTKYETLLEVSKSYKEVIVSKEKLQDEFGSVYEFSNWLAQNKSEATEKEIVAHASSIKPINALKLEKIWNNIFYQATVQKDEALKDCLIELLKANHVVETISDKDNLKRIGKRESIIDVSTQSALVLPAFLFDEKTTALEETAMNTTQKAAIFIPDHLIQKKMKQAEALLKQEQLNVLQQDLDVLAEEYKTAYYTAYESAYEKYHQEVKLIYDRHTKEQEEIRKGFCSLVQVEKRIYDANDPCQQLPHLTPPKVPVFKFQYEKELSYSRLQEALDPMAYQTLLQSIHYRDEKRQTDSLKRASISNKNPQQLLDSIGTYAKLDGYLQTAIQNNNAALINSDTSSSNRLSSVGGMLVPVSNEISCKPFEYKTCGITTNLQRTATFFMGVPDPSWQMASIKVLLSNGVSSESYFLDYPILEQKGNQIVLYNVEGFPAHFSQDRSKSLLGLEIVFTNGCQKILPQVDIGAQLCYVGTLLGDCGENNDLNENAYIPQGFGIRLLGIADYKRIEQTVHCYIEGEVSNIENIMARAYREKSSRLLKRTEDTRTQIAEQEKEQFTDTSTTDRYEMQTEVNKLFQENKSLNAYVNAGYSGTFFTINGGVAHASNTSKEESIRNVISQVKEITHQAQDRVINKVKRERIQKVIDEFEENNKHGYDNRKGDKHVVGVYRWVDKLYKNQIYNYGKRMMFEFLIPEPGKLHTVAMKGEEDKAIISFEKPQDPRTSSSMKMATAAQVDEINAQFWAAKFNAEIPVLPDQKISLSAAFADNGASGSYVQDNNFVGGKSFSIDLPDDYKTTHITGDLHFVFVPKKLEIETHGIVSIAGKQIRIQREVFDNKKFNFPLLGVEKKVEVNLAGGDVGGISVSLNIDCKLKVEAIKRWQQGCFQVIIAAYNEALDLYNAKIQNEQNKVVEIKKTNPGFYRQIENTVLRKNCISYLVRDADMGMGFTSGHTIDSFEINQSKSLSAYSSMVKFIEQAFEWDLISYHFYPFYWAEKGRWADLYTYDESDDPIFRNFMQSGMARVVVTVRPGFEEAVQLYMSTGKIWNGGEIPVIGNPLYLSIIDEIRQTETVKEGKAWITRIPTSLTILQADSAGLVVDKALPCNCDNLEDFEDPTLVPCSDRFVINKNLIGGDTGPENGPIQ